MSNSEFKVGDKVTYKPYEKCMPGEVVSVSILMDKYDGSCEWSYKLKFKSGANLGAVGRSISAPGKTSRSTNSANAATASIASINLPSSVSPSSAARNEFPTSA